MTTESSSGKIGSLKELEAGTGGEYQRWSMEIEAAEKELQKWQRGARKIVKEFRAEKVEVSPSIDSNFERKFNLFSANTQILSTALLNQIPKPSANREFKDPQDDLGRVAAEILERALLAHNSSNNAKNYKMLRQVVQDMLVPGVGCSWHTYHAETETRKEEPSEELLRLNPEAEALEYDELVSEEMRDEYVYWEDLIWSPARTREEVRWIGRKVYMTRDASVKRFGKEKGNELALEYNPKKNDSRVETQNNIFEQAIVYEIWDKETKEVIWWSKGYEKGLLDKKPDFLNLEGFYPCPEFLTATISNGKFIPIPDYNYTKDQYRELNETNTRLGLLVRACRVVGAYDKTQPAIKDVLNNAAENTMVPVDQWAAFAEKGGIKGIIDWIPLDQIVKTIEQLLRAREDIKAQIYEVTGMSDIIRGASKASETLGAQKIKAQYASMRIQDRQKNVVEYASAVFDIQGQIMRKHLSVEEIAKLAQVEFMMEDQQLIVQALQLIKSPEFNLRVRVESDTLSDIDFQAEKMDRMEYMTTITNYLKETMQTITSDPILGPFLMQLLQFSLAGFKLGKKFEAELDKTFSQIQQKLANPPPPQKTPEQQKVEGEMQLNKQEFELKAQGQQQELQFQREKHQQEMKQKRDKSIMDLRTNQIKAVTQQQAIRQKAAIDQQKAQQQIVLDHQKAMREAMNPTPRSGNGQTQV